MRHKSLPVWITALLTVLIMILASAVVSRAEQPLVVIVNSYESSHPWVTAHNGALIRELKDEVRLVIRDLDSKRLGHTEVQQRADSAFEMIVGYSPSVVVLTDDNAVKLLGRRIMSAGIPIVFLGVNENPRTYLGEMELATGVLERPLYKRSLISLQGFLPTPIRRSLILFDQGATSKVIYDTVFNGRQHAVLGDVEVDVQLLGTYAEWREAVSSAKKDGYDVLFAGLYHSLKDEQGETVDSEDVIHWTSAESKVPVFGYWEFAVGKCKALGGLVNSGVPQGLEAANLVRRILAGEPLNTIYPVSADYGNLMFSLHELNRWGINLPSDFFHDKGPLLLIE